MKIELIKEKKVTGDIIYSTMIDGKIYLVSISDDFETAKKRFNDLIKLHSIKGTLEVLESLEF